MEVIYHHRHCPTEQAHSPTFQASKLRLAEVNSPSQHHMLSRDGAEKEILFLAQQSRSQLPGAPSTSPLRI